jgi:hypothetical protein
MHTPGATTSGLTAPSFSLAVCPRLLLVQRYQPLVAVESSGHRPPSVQALSGSFTAPTVMTFSAMPGDVIVQYPLPRFAAAMTTVMPASHASFAASLRASEPSGHV